MGKSISRVQKSRGIIWSGAKKSRENSVTSPRIWSLGYLLPIISNFYGVKPDFYRKTWTCFHFDHLHCKFIFFIKFSNLLSPSSKLILYSTDLTCGCFLSFLEEGNLRLPYRQNLVGQNFSWTKF